MWQKIKTKLVEMLEANALIGEVYDYEAEEFAEDPVATVIASSNESDYRTTNYNRRIYAFSIMLWVKRTSPRSNEEAEEVLTDLVDSVLDDFDRYYTLGTGSPGAALSLPTGYTMVRVQALPSSWFYANQRETMYRVAQIDIKIEIDVDVTSIS